MGLDMYLDKELTISEFDAEKELVDKTYKMLKVTDESGNYKHLSFKLPAIYWRKSNQIHKWFVDNVQGGNDDCGNYHVNVEDLKKLLGVVKAQLDNKEKVILKPQEGFFFGTTAIDEWYWEDLERTKVELEREIDFYEKEQLKKRHWYFEYHSSW